MASGLECLGPEKVSDIAQHANEMTRVRRIDGESRLDGAFFSVHIITNTT